MLTKTQKAAWTARLHDPASEQLIGNLYSCDRMNAMCCLGHFCAVLMPGFERVYERKQDAHYNFVRSILGTDLNTFIDRNDGNGEWFRNRQSLSQIADYVDTLPTSD